ncbi:hypothetical protein AVEN_133585-1, partial [Araneus ventricosus]
MWVENLGLVGQDDSQTTTALRYQHLGWDCGIYFVRPIPTNMAQWENLSDILGGDVSRITLREIGSAPLLRTNPAAGGDSQRKYQNEYHAAEGTSVTSLIPRKKIN